MDRQASQIESMKGQSMNENTDSLGINLPDVNSKAYKVKLSFMIRKVPLKFMS